MKTASQKSAPIGRKLVHALTKNQVANLLTAIFDLLDDQKLNELHSNVDEDIATTLSRLVATKTQDTKQPSPKRIVSDQKYIQGWEELWSAWEEVALQVGEEEGKYVYQEHHWEHPYFDEDSLSEDLDKIAEKLGQAERAAALKLQLVTYEKPFHWEAVIEVYRELRELPCASTMTKLFDQLFNLVLRDDYTNRASAPARRAWLEKMQGEKFIPQLMSCWKQNVATLVPDPARTHKSDYEEHASWLVVVNELNPAACRAIIDKWKIDHKKRRNLWMDLEAQHLPV